MEVPLYKEGEPVEVAVTNLVTRVVTWRRGVVIAPPDQWNHYAVKIEEDDLLFVARVKDLRRLL